MTHSALFGPNIFFQLLTVNLELLLNQKTPLTRRELRTSVAHIHARVGDLIVIVQDVSDEGTVVLTRGNTDPTVFKHGIVRAITVICPAKTVAVASIAFLFIVELF